jgi:hypothetical protein
MGSQRCGPRAEVGDPTKGSAFRVRAIGIRFIGQHQNVQNVEKFVGICYSGHALLGFSEMVIE